MSSHHDHPLCATLAELLVLLVALLLLVHDAVDDLLGQLRLLRVVQRVLVRIVRQRRALRSGRQILQPLLVSAIERILQGTRVLRCLLR